MKIIISKRQKQKSIAIALILTLLITIITFIICIFLWPRIVLDKDNITLEVLKDFKEPNYKAYIGSFEITNKVKKKGHIDTNKIGDYKIEYTVNYYLFQTKKYLDVHIVDTEKPVIELKGNSNVSICPNKEYQEEGYKATDNYDGDLTDKVSITKEVDKITYQVKDSSGNTISQIRNINREDKEKPNLKLNGRENTVIYKGDTYNEVGATAIDNCDGDISSNVIRDGSVDTSKIGNYFITYTVVDSSGNESKVIRTVRVVSKPISGKGIIYLTFDDGPSNSITPKILDILKQEQVPATFFIINHSDNLNYLIKREYDEGHTVALHSYTHDYSIVYKSVDSYFTDLTSIQNKVYKITGTKSYIIRFPGGSSNTISKRYQTGIMTKLVTEVQNRGYHYFDWNISSGDAGEVKSSQEVYNNVINGLSKNRENIILMHDFEKNYYTLNALSDIIHYGKENGYTFKKITMDTTMVTHRVSN